jgi:hypothetical protein
MEKAAENAAVADVRRRHLLSFAFRIQRCPACRCTLVLSLIASGSASCQVRPYVSCSSATAAGAGQTTCCGICGLACMHIPSLLGHLKGLEDSCLPLLATDMYVTSATSYCFTTYTEKASNGRRKQHLKASQAGHAAGTPEAGHQPVAAHRRAVRQEACTSATQAVPGWWCANLMVDSHMTHSLSSFVQHQSHLE